MDALNAFSVTYSLQGEVKFTVALKKQGRRQEAEGRREEDLTKVSSLITHYSLLITQKNSPTPFFTSPLTSY